MAIKFDRWSELKRKVLIKQASAEKHAEFLGDTAAADEFIYKSQAFSSVFRCMESLEERDNLPAPEKKA